MKFNICGFSQQKLIDYGLDDRDALILRYFIDFKDTGSMVKRIIENECYYWFKYSGVITELPILKIKRDTVYRRMKKMCKVGILEHKTIKKEGNYSFFKTGPNYFNIVSSSDLNPSKVGFKSGTHTDLNPEQKITLLIDHSTKDIYSLVVNYLNKKCGTNYKSTTKKTQSLINARLREGFTVEDFYTVIDTKVKDWKGQITADGKNMENFLRPETLFGNKFEGYLNQKNKKVSTNEKVNNNAYKKFEFD